jgi:hypothetical protein
MAAKLGGLNHRLHLPIWTGQSFAANSHGQPPVLLLRTLPTLRTRSYRCIVRGRLWSRKSPAESGQTAAGSFFPLHNEPAADQTFGHKGESRRFRRSPAQLADARWLAPLIGASHAFDDEPVGAEDRHRALLRHGSVELSCPRSRRLCYACAIRGIFGICP